MANKFFPRMPNLVEVLNQMWDAFVAGPYNALPLIGGVLTGALVVPKISLTGLLEARYINVGPIDPGNAETNIVRSFDPQPNTFALIIETCAAFRNQIGNYGVTGISSIDVSCNHVTRRSITTGGTINAGGADYAEYLIKGLLCGTIAPGQIVGIDADGHLTDKWDLAISFAVKSTNPCMVGGDNWAEHLGPRPPAPARQEIDTDEQWADTLADARVAQQQFDVELEQARQAVDRIAFAGQVPVNLQGATPGQYIVPVQDGAGITGLAIDEADITLRQYMRAIGRVIAIEDDGRARIVVKVA